MFPLYFQFRRAPKTIRALFLNNLKIPREVLLLLFFTTFIQCTAARIGHFFDAYFAASKACCYIKHKPYCACLNICYLEQVPSNASIRTFIIKLMFNLKKSPDVISSLQTVVFILLCVGVSIPQDLKYSSSKSQFSSDSAFFWKQFNDLLQYFISSVDQIYFFLSVTISKANNRLIKIDRAHSWDRIQLAL